MQTNTKRLPKGFTLLELLTVTAILGILSALVVGACVKAKAKAQRVVCQSNLRQVGLAMRMYLDDNSGRFPMRARIIATDRDGVHYWGDGWVEKLLPYATPQVFRCPSDPWWRRQAAGGRNGGGLDEAQSDYWLYGGLEQVVTNGSRVFVIGVRESVVRRATETFMFHESWGNTNSDLSGIPAHHSGGANYCFVDGHVKWLKPKQADALHNQKDF